MPQDAQCPPRMRDHCGTLRDQWYVACVSGALRTKPLQRVILEEALVLFRDAEGRARCLLDRCLHRNALLSQGSVADGCIVCPYHGWRFDADGRLVAIPSEGPDSVGRPNRAVRTFPVREESGLVWVYLGDPDDIVGEPFAFPRFGEEGWGTYTMVTPFDNSVTNCVENFMDVPHTITVHRGWFRSDKKQAVRTTVERTPGSVLVTYHQDADSIGFSGRVFNPRNEPVTHTDQFTMPNITRVDYDFGTSRSFIITSQCTPISPMKTLVYTAITYRLGNPIFNALGRMVLPPYTRKVIQQDVEIMANQGESLKRYGQDFSNAPVDVIHQWIQSLRDFARSGGQGEPPAPATAEVTFWI